MLVENESLWLNQLQIAELFGVKQPAVSKHIKNIYNSSKLDENSYYDNRKLWRYLMNKSIAKMEKLINPKNSIVFAGRIPEKMPAFANFLFGISRELPLNLINHEEIDKWCEGI